MRSKWGQRRKRMYMAQPSILLNGLAAELTDFTYLCSSLSPGLTCDLVPFQCFSAVSMPWRGLRGWSHVAKSSLCSPIFCDVHSPTLGVSEPLREKRICSPGDQISSQVILYHNLGFQEKNGHLHPFRTVYCGWW